MIRRGFLKAAIAAIIAPAMPIVRSRSLIVRRPLPRAWTMTADQIRELSETMAPFSDGDAPAVDIRGTAWETFKIPPGMRWDKDSASVPIKDLASLQGEMRELSVDSETTDVLGAEYPSGTG